MPMFDDPNKELNRLQEELLAEGDTSWEDELADLDTLLADYDEEKQDNSLEEEYKEVNELHRRSHILLEEEADDEAPVKAKKPREKGVVGLIVVACLEVVAIIGLLAWWYLCLR